jgi:hypothetical protein
MLGFDWKNLPDLMGGIGEAALGVAARRTYARAAVGPSV